MSKIRYSQQTYVISFKLWQKCENAIKTKRPHSSRLFQNLGSLFHPSHHPVVVVCFFLPFHTFPNPSALQCVPNMMLLEILNARATENVTRVCTDRESKPFVLFSPFRRPIPLVHFITCLVGEITYHLSHAEMVSPFLHCYTYFFLFIAPLLLAFVLRGSNLGHKLPGACASCLENS